MNKFLRIPVHIIRFFLPRRRQTAFHLPHENLVIQPTLLYNQPLVPPKNLFACFSSLSIGTSSRRASQIPPFSSDRIPVGEHHRRPSIDLSNLSTSPVTSGLESAFRSTGDSRNRYIHSSPRLTVRKSRLRCLVNQHLFDTTKLDGQLSYHGSFRRCSGTGEATFPPALSASSARKTVSTLVSTFDLGRLGSDD